MPTSRCESIQRLLPACVIPDRDAALLLAIDKIHTRHPFLGSRRIVDALGDEGTLVNRKAVQRLMRTAGIQAIYRRPRTSRPGSGAGHRVFPNTHADVPITRPNHVRVADITIFRCRLDSRTW